MRKIDDNLFDVLGLEDDEKKSFQSTYETLETNFNLSYEQDFKFSFKAFSVFKDLNNISIRDTFKITRQDSFSYLTFTSVDYSLIGGRTGRVNGSSYQIWGIAYLKRNYGCLLIQPETLFLKLTELIEPIEIDINEDKEFSRKFYVLASDNKLALDFLNKGVRENILDLKDNEFYIEVKDNVLIIGNRKNVSPKYGLKIGQFIEKISTMNI